MNKILHIILISLFSLTVFSCGEKEEEKEAPVIAEVYPVTTPTSDPTPDYTFSSTKAGTITYGGSCSSGTTSATSGNNTITFLTLSAGTYSDCTIIVTDSEGNASNTLTITSFIVDTTTTTTDTTAPTVTSVSTTADNQSSVSITDNITVTFSEAMDTTYVTTSTSDTNCAGTIRVSSDNFSTCVKMSSSPASSNSNKTFTLDPYDNLTAGTTYKTRITTGVKDTAGNALSSQYETSSGFTPPDLTAPTVTSVSTTADNQSSIAITDNITVSFSEAMDNTSITTNTDDSSCYGTLRVSSDNFSSCVQMASSPSSSNSGMTFTLDPYDNLTVSTTYKTRVTTGVKDAAGNALSGQYETSNGFTTWAPSGTFQMGGAIQGTELSLSNAVTTLAGTTGSSGRTNATGTAASFNKPTGITSDGNNLYVAEYSNHIIRKIVISSGEVTTIAGQNSTGSNDGTGTAAKFHYPHDLTTDGTNIYVSDYSNDTIRKIVISTGEVTTFAGVAGSPGFINGTGTEARFEEPWGITTDGTNLYVAERKNNSIRKIVISTQVVSTLAGGSGGFADGTGTSAKFWKLKSITTDGINIFAADSGNNRIRKIVISSGVVTTLAGSGTGSADGTGTGASLYAPAGIVTDGTNLYVASQGNHNIRKIVISSGVVTTIAGSAGNDGTTDGSGSDARFEAPMGITTDGTYLYVSDRSNHTVRKIE